MMKKRLILAALSLAALSACPGHGPESLPSDNILEFQEQARVSVANDTMHMALLIAAQHPDRRTAGETANRRLAALQEKLKKYSKLKVELANRGVYPHYGRNNQITHWEDSVELRVKGTDFEAMGQIIAESRNEAVLRGVWFSVSPEQRAKAMEQASTQALDAVHRRAAFLSKKLGFEGYDLVRVSLDDSFEQKPQEGAAVYAQDAAAVEMAAAPMSVPADQSGEQDISQNVRVTVKMK